MEKMSLPYEVWRAVVGYEGYYEVSNFGRLKSLSRVDYKGHVRKERILKPTKKKNGYLHLILSKNGVRKDFLVHRLVAEAFIPNPDNLLIVNHRDENKENNFVFVKEDGSVDFQKSNLEWCDYRYSTKYGTRTERAAKAMTNGKLSKPVYQYTLDGTFVREWPSLKEIYRQTGWYFANISACCRGERKSAYGYVWSYTKKAENF